MATLTNKFHVKDTKNGNKVYECTCYTTQNEATPTLCDQYGAVGSCWEIKNNNTICYLGLWPYDTTSIPSEAQPYITPLTIRKDDWEYYVMTQVDNEFTVTIVQSAHQTIEVECNANGTSAQKFTETFTAKAGSAFIVTVKPETGYMAGTPNIESGFVNSNITISASPASIAEYLVTINQSANQTITVRLNDTTDYTSSFNANYGDTYTVTVTPNEGYIAGSVKISGDTDLGYIVRGPLTISATPATIIKCTITVTQPENGRIEVNGQTGTSFAINYGTSTKVEAIADSGYVVDALYVDPV